MSFCYLFFFAYLAFQVISIIILPFGVIFCIALIIKPFYRILCYLPFMVFLIKTKMDSI